uniref:Bromodomain adjacent to zinc finger domain protein 1A n=1 Tax=Sinocyclocheilus grahami TaxID=75366 RepID=A0A672PC43_SINGR
MPLLHKKPFVRRKPPADLRPDEEVFLCKVTHEIFRSYDEFFERTILCNSLVWSCAVTGKPGLTYQEALESERKARLNLQNFPNVLLVPLLHLTALTHRSRLHEICDDVYAYVKERFFPGEIVDVVTRSGNQVICCILDCTGCNACLFLCGAENSVTKRLIQSDFKVSFIIFESGSIFVEDLFSHFFPDEPPVFIFSPPGKGRGCRPNDASPTEVGYYVCLDVMFATWPSSFRQLEKEREDLIEAKRKEKEDKEKKREEMKRIVEEEKQRRKEEKERMKVEKEREREKLKEEKKKYAERLKLWSKPREDMECDDLKELPKPLPVKTRLPPELFGDALMVLEFLNAFGELFDLKDEFPDGVTLEVLEEALVGSDPEGPLCELLFFFLSAIFQALAEEQEEVAKDQVAEADTKDLSEALEDDADPTQSAINAVATLAAAWPQLHQGCSLKQLDLDSCTLSEILRLHILASGADCMSTNAKFRYQKQGGFGSTDDPCVELRLSNQCLLKKLSCTAVYDLLPGEKLKILHSLCGKLLTLVSTRDFIEDNADEQRSAKQELRELKAEQHRREREEAAERYGIQVQYIQWMFYYESLQETKDSTLKPKVGPSYPQSTVPAERFMESRLRDLLLDIEDRIYQGTLGAIKVLDRNSWRAALENGNYEPLNPQSKENGLINGEEEPMEIYENHIRVKDRLQELKAEGLSATSTTVSTPQPVNNIVHYLAHALAQTEQGIERKFLKAPLGDEDAKKDQKLKKKDKKKDDDQSSEKDDGSESGRQVKTVQERWRESLLACSSLSQVFLHLSTLERSIVWAKSILNARCKVCRRKGDAENMLLCDACDRGYHIFCVRPKLKAVPSEDWFCPECRPKQRSHRINSRQRSSIDSEEEMEDEEESEQEEEESEEEDDESEEEQSEEEELVDLVFSLFRFFFLPVY